MSIINIKPGYGTLTASVDTDNLKPISQLVAETNSALDEIASRQRPTDSVAPDLVRDTINEKQVWAKYNRHKAIGLK